MTSSKLAVLQWIRGLGIPPRYALASVFIAMTITSYILFIGQILRPDIYYFQDGTTYHDFFPQNVHLSFIVTLICVTGLIGWLALAFERKIMVLGVPLGISFIVLTYLIFQQQGLNVIALLSLPAILAILAYSYKMHFPVKFPERMTRIIINHLSLVSIALGCLSIGGSLMDLDSIRYDPFYQIFVLFSTLSPILVFLIIMSVPLRILFEYVGRIRFSNVSRYFLLLDKDRKISRITKVLCLAFCIAVSIILIVIPYLSNENESPLGVDTPIYLDWISLLENSENAVDYLTAIFSEISDGDRPVSLLFIQLLFQLTGGTSIDRSDLIELGIPLAVFPFSVLLAFYLCRLVTNDDRASLIAAFLYAVGPSLVVGLYGGLFANLIALVPYYLALIFLLRFLKSGVYSNIYLFAASLILLLFSHLYTWTILTVFLGIYLTITLVKRTYPRKLIFLSLLVVAFVIGVDLLRGFVTGSELGLQRDLSFAQSTDVGLSQFAVRWDNLVRTVQVHLGGLYSNFILLGFVIAGIFLIRMNSAAWIFVGTFVSVGILPLFFGNVTVLSRVIYDIPLQIPAAIALTSLLNTDNGMTRLIACLTAVLAVSIVFVTNLQ